MCVICNIVSSNDEESISNVIKLIYVLIQKENYEFKTCTVEYLAKIIIGEVKLTCDKKYFFSLDDRILFLQILGNQRHLGQIIYNVLETLIYFALAGKLEENLQVAAIAATVYLSNNRKLSLENRVKKLGRQGSERIKEVVNAFLNQEKPFDII